MTKGPTSKELEKQKIVIYKAADGKTSVDITLLDDTLWLSINQIAELFEKDKSVISRHLKNIFDTGELKQSSAVAKFATVQTEGKRAIERQIDYYNLDAIISVGYRVNSKIGTEFRKWASQILKDHLAKGYSINQQQLNKKSIVELQKTIDLLSKTMINQELVNEIGTEILQIITKYTSTWDTLRRFDEDELENKKLTAAATDILNYKEAKSMIEALKHELTSRSEATSLFGHEREESLKSILGNIEQSFGGQALYPSLQERATHLLYFIIKDHPFSDGNKRIGCLLFLMYITKSKLNIRPIENNALIALALLVAESNPDQKNTMIQLIMYLLQD